MQENRSSAEQLVYLPLDKVYIHPLNVRKVRDEQKIAELKESIKSLGRIDEPITVIPDLNGKYGVIKGSRRYTALKELVNERWAPSGSGIPCIIRQMDDFEAHQVSAIENIQRDDLQPFEKQSSTRHS
jgi:ParB family chromosome partitioning protein